MTIDPTSTPPGGVDPTSSTESTESTGTSGSTGTTPSPQVNTQDTISSSAGEVRRLSIGEYAATISAPQLKLKEIIDEIDKTLHLKGKDLLKYLEQRAEDARQVKNDIKNGTPELINLETSQNVKIDQMNATSTAFVGTPPAQNSLQADQDAVNTMNQAITQFNNGQITAEQFELAVNNYNAYAAARNPQIANYNAQVDSYNTGSQTDLARINELRALLNLPPIDNTAAPVQPLQTITPNAQQPPPPAPPVPNYTAPVAALPAPTGSVKILTDYDTAEVPDVSTSLDNVYKPLVDQIDQSISTLRKQKELNDAFNEKINRIKRSKKIYRPDAYLYSFGNVSSGGSQASSIGLGSMLTKLDHSNLQGIMSQAIYKASLQNYDQETHNEATLELNRTSLQFVQGNALAAAIDGNRGLSLDAALGENVTNNLSDIDGQVTSIINTDLQGNASLQGALSGGAKLSALLLTTAQIANSLNAPGLFDQVLGQAVPGALEKLGPPSPGLLIQGTLADAGFIGTLQKDLEKIALSLGISPTVVGPALENAVVNALNSDSKVAPDALYQVFRDGLLASGLKEDQADALANSAILKIVGETPNPYVTDEELEASISASALNAAIRKTSSQQRSQTLSDQLQAQLVRERINQDTEEVSNLKKEINKAFQKLLDVNKDDISGSIEVANRLAQNARQEQIARDHINKSNLNQDILQSSLADEIIKNTAIASDQANRYASEVLAKSIQEVAEGNSEAALRSHIQNQLIRSGLLNSNQAREAAANLQIEFNNPNAPASITDLGAGSVLSDGELTAQIRNRAIALGADTATANKLAANFSITNPLSITNQIQQQIKHVEGETGIPNISESIVQNARSLNNPLHESVTNLNDITNRLMDPANTFAVQSSLENSRALPGSSLTPSMEGGFQQTISIPV